MTVKEFLQFLKDNEISDDYEIRKGYEFIGPSGTPYEYACINLTADQIKIFHPNKEIYIDYRR